MANETVKAPTMAEMQARIAQLEAELTAKNNQTREIFFKVAEESGAISAYGVQNIRPVTLYSTQWERLIAAATGSPVSPDSPLGKFMASAAKYLSQKGETEQQAKDKALLRKAESHGIVSHPKNKAAA